MSGSMYIETELTLNSLDLIQIESLLNARLKELRAFKKEADGWMPKMLADEQIGNYRDTLARIKDARAEIKRIKAEADAEFFARRNNENIRRRKPATRK